MELMKKIVATILTWEARLVLRRYRPKVVAITGSVGKTSGKDALYAALSGVVHVRKSEKSFNSEFGVPLTILGCETGWNNPFKWMANIIRGLTLILLGGEYPRWLILEIGADRPGDIRSVARWLRPDIAVITGVPEVPVHVEYFDSSGAIAREKRSLAEHVKAGGKLVINGDDARMVEMCAEFRGMMVRYGFESGNDFVASHEEIIYEEGAEEGAGKPVGMRFRVGHAGSSFPVALVGSLGRPRAYAALAALAAAEIVGIDGISIAQSLSGWVPPPGRMRLIAGANDSTIIDDTYNSSPAAALSALDTLGNVVGRKKIAVLGDMLELGKYSSEAHRNIGARAAEVADMLITLGFRSRAAGEAALDAGLKEKNVREYEQNESRRAGEELRSLLKKGDIVLVKGSQSMRMERTVEALMAEPEKAKDLLVRQDEEWLAKM